MGHWPVVLIVILTVTASSVTAFLFPKKNASVPAKQEELSKIRALGCLYGQLIGDSLGSRYEFDSAEVVREKIQKERNLNGFLPILGGGPHRLQPGQVTDDSEMALSLASSLIHSGGFDAADIACSYVYWAHTKPIMGLATRNAVDFGDKYPPFDASKELVHQEVLKRVRKKNRGNLSNGCLMRISPLAIYSVNIPFAQVKELVYAECSLTHYEEDVKDAAYVYVVAIRELLKRKSNKEAFEAALSMTRSKRIREHLVMAQEKAVPVNIGGKLVFGDDEATGYVGVALQSAFYELLHGTSFHQSMIDAISRGGDTDTNGAIVGALLGARFGVNRIPYGWITTVSESKPRQNFDVVDYNVERIVQSLLNHLK